MTQHLLFDAGGQTFGLPITQTDKIITLDNHIRLPEVSSYIVGLQEVEGAIRIIIDIADRLYQQPETNQQDADIILVSWKDTEVGLLVNNVLGVETFDTKELNEPVKEKVDGLSLSYISAFVQNEKGITIILDSHYLFDNESADELNGLVNIQTVCTSAPK